MSPEQNATGNQAMKRISTPRAARYSDRVWPIRSATEDISSGRSGRYVPSARRTAFARFDVDFDRASFGQTVARLEALNAFKLGYNSPFNNRYKLAPAELRRAQMISLMISLLSFSASISNCAISAETAFATPDVASSKRSGLPLLSWHSSYTGLLRRPFSASRRRALDPWFTPTRTLLAVGKLDEGACQPATG